MSKKEQKMQTQVQTQTTTNKALAAMPEGSWGSEGISSQDIVISKILLQQALSKFTVEGKAKSGDFCDSVSGEILGDKNNPLEIIPINIFKTWVIEAQINGQKYEYQRIEPLTAANESLPWEYEDQIDGKTYKFRRNKCLNFYVLLANKDKTEYSFPFVVAFRRTSLMAGKQLATHFAKCSMLKVPPASKTLKLTCTLTKNDLGSFYVYGIEQGRKTTPDELSSAYAWYSQLQQAAVRVDDSDLKEETTHTGSDISDKF